MLGLSETQKGTEMSITSKEHYELMEMFERIYGGERLDRERKENWMRGYVYQNGETNKLFIAFREGVAYGKTTDK